MRIAIDCRWIFPKISGIGKHTENLVKGLSKVDRKNTYLFIKDPLTDYGLFSPVNQIKLPKLLRRLDVDIYHSTNFMIPLFMRKDIKVVITIHDLIPWKFPEFTPRAKKTRFNWVFRRIIKKAADRADKIIAVSENTARDIVECLKVDPKKIAVVYNGISAEFITAEERGGEKEDYILFVGRSDPYKNLTGLIKAYKILLDKYKIENKLLIVGEEDNRYPEARVLADSLRLGNKVMFYGYTGTNKMLDIYRKARVLAMPSLYEGFGYPAIEAMACETPVVVSTTAALREIVKDKGLYADPLNPEQMADKIFEAINNGQKDGAKDYARRFTVERMAEETVKVYESCISA